MRPLKPWLYTGLVAALLLGSFAFICFGVPPAQRVAGTWAQKIFYYHVSSAMISFGCFFGGLVAGVGYLAWKDDRMARAGRAMVEMGWVAASLVLVSGPIWARPVWGKFWNWEPRLTSFAFLWCGYAAYLILGPAVEDRDKRRTLQSVYAILAFVTVPLVIYSTRLMAAEEQLHPPRAETPPRMFAAWSMALFALSSLWVGMIYLRYQVESLADSIHDLRAWRVARG